MSELAKPRTEVEELGLIQIRKVVQNLNDSFKRDPAAVQRLLEVKTPCNLTLALKDHLVSEDERSTTFKVTAFGLLNSVVGPLTGYLVTVVVRDGQMLGFGYQPASDRY